MNRIIRKASIEGEVERGGSRRGLLNLDTAGVEKLCPFDQRSTPQTRQNRLKSYYRGAAQHQSSQAAMAPIAGNLQPRFQHKKENERMIKLLIHWVVSALTLLVISHFLHGFVVRGLEPALIAALVIGLLNATLGWS
jgi:hypothetical protein